MAVFRPDTRTVRIKDANSFATLIVLTAIFFTLRIAVDLILSSSEMNESLTRLIVSNLLWGFGCASLTVFYAKMQLREYELFVDDNVLRVKSTWFDRSVHRGQIRTMIEHRHGLLVSSRGRLGTFLWGGVLITRMLPEYEQIKGVAEKWKIAA